MEAGQSKVLLMFNRTKNDRLWLRTRCYGKPPGFIKQGLLRRDRERALDFDTSGGVLLHGLPLASLAPAHRTLFAPGHP